MKNIILPIIIVSFTIISCSTQVDKNDLSNLNGDWEITQVETPEGKILDYGVNMTVDYFEIDSISLNQGIRKKFMPQFDGTRLTNGIEEKFIVVDSIGSIYLKYKTDYATWTEQITALSPTEFTVKNENDIVYKYKKYEQIIINKE